jgi:hypothetical protein
MQARALRVIAAVVSSCLSLTVAVAADVGPSVGGSTWRDVLQWEHPRFLTGNLVFLRPGGESGPGIGDVGTVATSSWSPSGIGTPGQLLLTRKGQALSPALMERRITPFAVWERYGLADATWSQRMCLSRDVFILEGTLAPHRGIGVTVEGRLQGADGAVTPEGLLSGVFAGGEAEGLAFSFWCSMGAPVLERVGRQLVYRVQAGEASTCSILFSVAPTRAEAEMKLCAARGGWDRAVAAEEDEWARFFNEVMPPLVIPDPSWSTLLHWIGYWMKANSFRLPDDMWPRTTGVWKGSCTAIPVENRSLHAIGERWLTDPSLAVGDLHAWRSVRPDGAGLVWVIAARAVDKLWCLSERAPETCAKATELVAAFLRRHDHDGDFLPEFRSNLTGLGWDNAARFDPATDGRYEQGARLDRDLVPIDTSVLLVLASEAAAELAMKRGDRMRARYLRGVAEEVRAAIEARAWDEDSGCYFDLMSPGGEPTGVLTPASLFPLWVGLGDGRVERLLGRSLTPTRLWPGFPLPTCSLEDTGHGDYWRGKVALRINWAVLESFRAAGQCEHGRALLANMVSRYALYGYDCAEMYDATDGGAGQWPHSPEVSLLLDVFLKSVVGIEPHGDGGWVFAPLFLDQSWPYLRFGPAVYGPDTVEVRWDRPGDEEDWFDDGIEGHWMSVNNRRVPVSSGGTARR